MTYIGKTLVILNFIFALVVGGFLVIDFATRTNWKTAYDGLKREMDGLKATRESLYQVAKKLENDIKKVENQNEELKQKIGDESALVKATEEKLNKDIEDYKLKLAGLGETLKQAQAELEREKTELVDRNKTIKQRETDIANLEGDKNKYRAEALSQEGRAKALQDRNEQLMEEVVRKNQELARIAAGGTGAAGGPSTSFRLTKVSNPPSVEVRGTIEAVDEKEPSLVQISVGSDKGLTRDNTLYAFRLRPEVKYLGEIRIVDVYPDRSVGRLETPPGAIRHRLQKGDQVSSRLSR